MMNKPKRHKSKLIQEIQQNRSAAEFEKTKKRMLLAVKIQDAIKAKGYTYTRFAELMEQHVSVISKWVSGTHNFTTDTLFEIEENLGITLINTGEEKPTEIINKYDLTVSVNPKDMLTSEYSNLLIPGLLDRYISLQGGMAATVNS
jgi:ribosome-binding protein aMBF1 (putative translation factor)